MGLVDVFAKWLLDKVNDIFFTKKNLSVEKRAHILHRFLLEAPTFCEILDLMIDQALRMTEDLSDLQGIKDSMKSIRWLDEDIAELKKQVFNDCFTSWRGIGQHVKELEFYFEQEGFPQLGKQLINKMSSIGGMSESLRQVLLSLHSDIANKYKDGIINKRQALLVYRNHLHKLSSEFDKLAKVLIDFARKVNE